MADRPRPHGAGPRRPVLSAPASAHSSIRTSSAGRTVLVVGSYPPAATAGAAVTLEMVRRLVAEGARPWVASPRAGAAPLVSPVHGLLAGRRLAQLRRVTRADDVVLCAERDLPVPVGGLPRGLLRLLQVATAHRLVGALSGFDHVTLVACGETAIPPGVWARLVFAADVVVERPDAGGVAGISVLGPPETATAVAVRLGRAAWRLAAPRFLGRHEETARRLLRRAAGAARRTGR